ncbi:hypothetical protein FMM05_07020 [Flavobacterium zepuense]|uniref:Transcriptional regulator, AbiEi antitoxin, Type IV TA system n=1 Tax=Flavobacterium zepuense TaxID=2593302 RepID=A0A552V657_9FLAO|nr:DUF6088 family protein [Flavobacterium zepuense]TRW25966.1 hypothetical protein FMM05_07020 [Flavobacterium zepuense]
MESIHNQIENKIKMLQKGKIIFISDFIEYGTAENVKKVLLRLEKQKLLIRLAHGIYLYPKIDKTLGVLYPSIEEIAKAIAKRDKARIVSTGIYALQQLGLSTQIPLNVVYLTDGAARKIKVGKRTINLKKTSPKNLIIKDKVMNNVIQAFKELGQNGVDSMARVKIKRALSKVPEVTIREAITIVPTWIRKEINQIIESK